MTSSFFSLSPPQKKPSNVSANPSVCIPPVNIRYEIKTNAQVNCIVKNGEKSLNITNRRKPKIVPTIGKKTTDPDILFSSNGICGKGILVRKRNAVYKYI